jgi:nicotinamide-nucleotide amidase
MIKASIITIGDELLIGQVIDTNSAWIAQQLNSIGIPVMRRVAVGDNHEDITQALNQESASVDIILITGGLGPTADDITKPLLCEYFGGKMMLHEPSLQLITHRFEQIFKRPMTDRNRKQAEVPDCCQVILNHNGTAPGMQFKKAGKLFFSLPGVPFEMMAMVEKQIIPLLSNQFNLPAILHRTLITHGIGESNLADLLVAFESTLPAHIKLAYLPNHGMVRLRLSGTSINEQILCDEIDLLFRQLSDLVAPYLVASSDAPMEKILGDLLSKNQQTIGTAESCSGGYIAHLLSSIPGASAYYKGSIISYDNTMKTAQLGVPAPMIEAAGAVSEAVVKKMAEGLLDRLQTDYAIAVSGIMGPGGGTDEKPVGTVWVAVGDKNEIITKRFHFRFNRQRNIQQTAINAMLLMRNYITSKN